MWYGIPYPHGCYETPVWLPSLGLTHLLSLEEINKGFDLMHAGESIRSVVVYCGLRLDQFLVRMNGRKRGKA